MAQQKTSRKMGGNLESNIRQSQSLLNVNELETRAKATVKDIEELYSALQGLVPKKSHHGGLGTEERKARSGPSGTDTDMEVEKPPQFRRYHSEKYPRKTQRDTNMNFVSAKSSLKKPVWEKMPEKPVLQRTFSNERHIVSDTEVELKDTTDGPPRLQRQFSLPAYDDDDNTNEINGTHKRSKFRIFGRNRQGKPKKKSSSWRSFFSTLSLKRRRSRKNGKNKIGYSTNTKTAQVGGNRTPKLQATNGSVSKQDRTPKSTPRQSFKNAGEKTGINAEMRKSERKRRAPEPPMATSSGNTASNSQIQTPDVETPEPRERSDTLETKSDQVQKKISAWYKHAVKETNSLPPKQPLRVTRSHENLLTDSEIIRKRGTFSSDTDSFSGGDRNRVNNIPKTRVRKTRARRNRRRERARFYSCPNVKLVSKALDEAERKANTPQTNMNSPTKDSDRTDNVSDASHVTTVKPVEAKLSFGSSLDNDEHVTDFMKLQTGSARNWLTRQCSKTTIGCIRPLQLNLFYSESPSRETVFRSRSTIRRPKINGKESGTGNPQEFAFKIRRSSSRRRKRRSFKRGQTRLPHQSPFYVPSSSLNLTPKVQPEEDSIMSKDSGLGSPDVNDEQRFATFPVTKRDQRLAKLHSESEDSGWASSHRHCANTSDTGIQTDPVIVMTAVSRVSRPVLPRDTNDESEA